MLTSCQMHKGIPCWLEQRHGACSLECIMRDFMFPWGLLASTLLAAGFDLYLFLLLVCLLIASAGFVWTQCWTHYWTLDYSIELLISTHRAVRVTFAPYLCVGGLLLELVLNQDTPTLCCFTFSTRNPVSLF